MLGSMWESVKLESLPETTGLMPFTLGTSRRIGSQIFCRDLSNLHSGSNLQTLCSGDGFLHCSQASCGCCARLEPDARLVLLSRKKATLCALCAPSDCRKHQRGIPVLSLKCQLVGSQSAPDCYCWYAKNNRMTPSQMHFSSAFRWNRDGSQFLKSKFS